MQGLADQGQERVATDRLKEPAGQACYRLREAQDLEPVLTPPRGRQALVRPGRSIGNDQRSAGGGQGLAPSGAASRTMLAKEAVVRIRKPISAREKTASRP